MTKINQAVRADLNFAAQAVDGIEGLRIASANRLGTMTRVGEDSDGLERGLGMTEDNKAVVQAKKLLEALEKIEHQAILDLQRKVRAHPVYPLVKRNRGLGEKQIGRLLSVIGDPYWHDAENRPRTVSELWSYCGYSVVKGSAQRRKKGELSNWSPDARMRAFLIAESCVKQPAGTRYRDVYDEARDKYSDAVHGTDCVRCGPKGKPALAGTPLSAGHQHARALRAISKELLRDLWLEAKAVHEADSN